MLDTARPVIGLLAQEIARSAIPESVGGKAYISAAYVKYIEAAGADVAPILTDWSDDEVQAMFHSVNGILIPGGGASLVNSRFMQNVKLTLKLAEEVNNAGDHFPVWGTCLGLEAMLVAYGGPSMLGDADAIDLAMPAVLTHGARTSRIFSQADDGLFESLSALPVKYHFHRKCIYKDTFLESKILTQKYSIVSFDEDRQKRKFVSIIEGKHYPFYAVQWHPEKTTHDYIPGQSVPRTKEAMRLSSYMGKFFINEAKKNHHSFSSKEFREESLIKNYAPVYTGELERVQYSYIFH